jgi:hypothetical protein
VRVRLPLTVRLVNSDTSACCGATFDSAHVIQNSSTVFNAKTP